MQIVQSNGRTALCSWTDDERTHTRVFPVDEIRRAVCECESLDVGMIVRHLSGGPPMTISEIADGWAWCEWIVSSHPVSRQLPCSELVEVKLEEGTLDAGTDAL